MINRFHSGVIFLIFILGGGFLTLKAQELLQNKQSVSVLNDIAPVLTATGDQTYCPQTHVKIVTSVTITDADDTGAEAVYIQITSGYVNGQDVLSLTGTHPTITAQWIPSEGKLKLYNISGGEVLYTDFIAAILDVEFYSSATLPSGTRSFSISLGQANYLPSNGHYYLYIPNIGITWTDAKIAAENTTYYGLQGYLATITAADEAQLAGEQAAGAGWIGGSDSQTEGVWKWMTGPEAGNNFTYTYWNTGEPNNLNDEDYAHITAPGVGLPGSWNDLSNTGSASGDYQPKGYVVEFGGMPGDPAIQTAASTRLTMVEITNKIEEWVCGSGSMTLGATASVGNVNWYNASTGGALIAVGNTLTTPVLNATTTYYVAADCAVERIPVTATVYVIPTITSTNSPADRCGAGTVTLHATADVGTIHWYDTPTGGSSLGTGINYVTPVISTDTSYYVEADNNGCISSPRTKVDVIIHPVPQLTDESVNLCQSGMVTLDADLPTMTYLWSTGETTQTISVTQPGTYTVDVTNTYGCPATKTITVIEYKIPIIDYVEVNEATVTIHMQNPQDYFEYSLDGITYQSSTVFTNVQGGYQTAYVRDTLYCSLDSEPFLVLFPLKFFTPNFDSYNDYWEVRGMSDFPDAKVYIFDRFGKLLVVLDREHPVWDGTYLNESLPASDYWFVMKIDDTMPEVRGHFTLKR